MPNVRYSDIRNGQDSAQTERSTHQDVSRTYKFFGVVILIAGIVSYGLPRMDSMDFLTHPLATFLSFALVLGTGYFGHKIIIDSPKIVAKYYLSFHAVAWGVFLSPWSSLHPSIDFGAALMSSAVVFICMSNLGQVDRSYVFGILASVIIAILGIFSAYVVCLLFLKSGPLMFIFAIVIINLISLLWWSEADALEIAFLELREDGPHRVDSGALGAMHLSASITAIFISTPKRILRRI